MVFESIVTFILYATLARPQEHLDLADDVDFDCRACTGLHSDGFSAMRPRPFVVVL